MSRADKRYRVIHEEKNLRLFAFNNFMGGYRPQPHLEEPAIVLRTRIKKDDEHPALQWQTLAQQIQSRKPMTHSTYVMDATRLEANTEQDEITHRGVEGPLLKRISNLLGKLVPKRAQLIGAGTTAEIVAKTAVCCSTLNKHHIIGKIILICPSLAEVGRSVEAAEKRMQQQGLKTPLNNEGKPLIEAVVLLDGANAHTAPEWLKLLGNSFRVTIQPIPAGTSLFWAIASAVIPKQREECPAEGSRGELQCYVINFRLSPYTKQAEQDIDPSPVTENPNLPPVEEDEEEEDPENKADEGDVEEAPIPSTESRYILADLTNAKNIRLRFEGNVVDAKTLANVHGMIELDELLPELNGVAPGTTVSLSAQLSRDEDGRTTLSTTTVEGLTTGGPSTYYACGSNFPTFNYSSVHQYYGAALIRGRKVVLCRSLEGVWKGMRFPHRPHCETYYTPYEAAMAAISDQCDVSADNFYFHPAVAPVTYYPTHEKGACVTLFIAFATNLSDGGVEDDSKELLEQLHDSYDWYSYRTASAKLTSKGERDVLVDIRRNVQRAYEAGLYTPLEGHGVFGEDVGTCDDEQHQSTVVAASETTAATAEDGANTISATGNGINVSELVVVQDPLQSFDVREVAAISRIDERRVKLWDSNKADADWVGIVGGKGCVVLSNEADMDVFAQQQLPPALAENCPPSVKVIVAATPDALEATFMATNATDATTTAITPAKVMGCLEYADALMCRHDRAFSPLVQHILKACRPELATISEEQLPALIRGDLDVAAVAAASMPSPCPPFLNIPFRSKLPFHPEKLFALLNNNSNDSTLESAWGCDKVLWVNGSAWVSTSPLHKVKLEVTPSNTSNSTTIAAAASDPWWCCVEEGDRPDGLDTSDWDQMHGSRRQEFNVLVLADPSKHDEVLAKVRASFTAALCAATDYRHWHRLADPFNF